MELGFVKLFTVKSHFSCIDEAASGNMSCVLSPESAMREVCARRLVRILL
jgi:hypothetical protein